MRDRFWRDSVRHWLIYFEDLHREPEVFSDEEAAKRRFLTLFDKFEFCRLFMEYSYLQPSHAYTKNQVLGTANASPTSPKLTPEAEHAS
jgi:hypothetical protein